MADNFEGANFTAPPTAPTEDDIARQKQYEADLAKNGGLSGHAAVNPNGKLYTWGGEYGKADKDANYFRNQAEAAQGRQAVQTNDANFNSDRVNSQYSRQYQNQASAMMMARAAGTVPSIAQMQADRQMQQASAEQASAAASARGPGALALAQQNAAGNVANMQSNISGQAQINAANERLQAEQAAFGAASNMRQGDFASMALDQQNSTTNAQLQAQQRGMNDSMTNNMYGNELGVRTNELTAQENYEAALQSGYFGQAGQQQQQQQINHQESQDAWNTAIGAAGTVAGYAAFLSDERTKNVGDWADPGALDARAGQDPTGAYASAPPDWLNSAMAAPQSAAADPYGVMSAQGERGIGVAGAPRGLAAARGGQPGGMFGPDGGSAKPTDADLNLAPGSVDAIRAGTTAGKFDSPMMNQDVKVGDRFSRQIMGDDTKAFDAGKAAATQAVDGGAAKPDAAAAGAPKGGDPSKMAGLAQKASKDVDKFKQHSQMIQFKPAYTPPRYLTSDTRAKEEAVLQRGRIMGMMEADKEAGRPYVVDSAKPPKDGVVDTRTLLEQRAAEAGANVFRTTIRHPLERAESDGRIPVVDPMIDGTQAVVSDAFGAANESAHPMERPGLASRVAQRAQAVRGGPVGMSGDAAPQAVGVGTITSDERAKSPVSDDEADRLRGEASKMAASPYYTPTEKKGSRVSDADAAKMRAFADGMSATLRATRDQAPATDVTAERGRGLASVVAAQRNSEPTVKPSDWYAPASDQAPLARANRSMASQPYTYKKEFTPPDQKPGELNVGPMAQNMAADPVASTAVKKTPDGLLVIDQNKLDRLHSAGISHLQERDDDKEERMRRLESLFGG